MKEAENKIFVFFSRKTLLFLALISSLSLIEQHFRILNFDQLISRCFFNFEAESFAGYGPKWSKMARNGPNWLKMSVMADVNEVMVLRVSLNCLKSFLLLLG